MNINEINHAIAKLNPFNADDRKSLKQLYKMKRKIEGSK